MKTNLLSSLNPRWLLAKPLLLPWLASSACTHTSVNEPVVVPPRLAAYFAACAPSEGALKLSWSKGDEPQGVAEADWLAAVPKQWQLQVVDPLGRIVLDLHRRADHLRAAGPLAAKLPALGIDDQGFLTASSWNSGLKAEELPCLLQMVAPQTWLAGIVRHQREGDDEQLLITDSSREIVISFKGLAAITQVARWRGRVCTRVRWSHWWGLRQERLSWCYDEESGHASMPLPQSYRLQWKKTDG